ncbi:hypothetical protein [Streptomyces sp. NPDC058812]|uniref:hypothetical protein n=1 Tax=unclassified Streptomyces TaxID=2593676 RepID=UPI0036C2E028
MTSDRSASPSGARLSRVVVLTTGATLGLGARCTAPPAVAGIGGTSTDTVALAADTAQPSVTLGARSVKQGGEVPFTAAGFPAGGTLSVKFDDKTLLKQITVGADGSASGTVTGPADAAKGAHWLRFLAPSPATTLKVEFTVVTATDGAAASSSTSGTTAPDTSSKTLAAASVETPVSYATIAWSAAAAGPATGPVAGA